MSDDIFDRYSRDAQPAQDTTPASSDDIFSKYDRPETETKAPERIKIVRDEPKYDAGSGFQGRMVSSMPIIGPLVDKLSAVAGAGLVQPFFPKYENTTFGQRYEQNLADINERNKLYGEEHPALSAAADVTGGALALGPMTGGPMSLGAAVTRTAPRVFAPMAPPADTLATNIAQRALGMRGASLGSKVYQGAAGMGAIEGTNQLLRGENPLQQGFFGPVPLAMAGGAFGPMIGEGVSAAGNKLFELSPRTSGPLAGTNSIARNQLTNAFEGETPESIRASKAAYGSAGLMMDTNQATRDIAGGLADIPGPAKGEIRETLRQRAAGQPQRLKETLDNNTVPNVDINQLTRGITQYQKDVSDPLYEAFRNTKIPPTPEIKALIPRLEAAGAFKMADELAGIKGVSTTQKFFTGGPQKEFPTAETWDLVKRGLDRRISTALDGGDNTLARELINLKEQMINEVQKTPGGKVWQKAREAFAEPAEIKNQIAEGQKTWERKTRVDDLAYELSQMSGPERAARVQGARDAIQEIMTNTMNGDTTARNKLLTEAGRQKLELLFGEKRAARLIKDLEAERNIAASKEEMVGGSPTSSKQARRNALLPQEGQPGYFRNIKLNQPSTFVPDWMTPQAIMEGSAAARHAAANEQLGQFMQIPMVAPEYNDLVRAISNEGKKRVVIQNNLNRLNRAVTATLAASGPGLRNRLLQPQSSAQ